MTVDLPTALVHRADSVDPQPIDPFAVIARGERLVRRRRRFVAAGAALAAALAIGATALADRFPERVDPASDHGVARVVTYGVGRVLHLGDREIDTGLDYLSIDVTDDGAALTSFDGGIWFTDGSVVDRVGATLPLRAVGRGVNSGVSLPAGRPRDWVVNDSSGSLLAWIEYRDGERDQPELVVYDTSRRAVTTRHPLESRDEDGARISRTVTAVAGREVFVSTTSRNNVTAPGLLRFSLDTGRADVVDRDAVEDAVRAVPRSVVFGSSAELGDVALQLARAWDPHHLDRIEVEGGRLTSLFHAATGRSLDFRIPDASETAVWAVQWIDDDRLVVVSGQSPVGDLLTCRISTLACAVTVERSWSDRDLIIPGFGGVGADYALVRAARASRG